MKWKIRGLMDRNDDTMEKLASCLNITYQTLSKKLNGHVDFNRKEIKIMKDRYGLDAEEINDVFFED